MFLLYDTVCYLYIELVLFILLCRFMIDVIIKNDKCGGDKLGISFYEKNIIL